MKKAAFLFTVIFAFAIAANAQGVAVGGTVENFSLPDTNGKVHTLNDMKGTAGAVIIFVSSTCPVVKGYNERMNQLVTDYASKGITVIGINSNSTETPAQIKAHAEAMYKFPVLIDKGNVLADKLGANSTPETFFVNANNVLLYHGAIDNDRTGSNVTTKYLTTAFDSAIAGKKIDVTSTKAIGCSIKRVGE